jgi:type I restriction enzyme S subunit
MEVVRLNGEHLLSGQHTILARRKDNSIIIGFGGHLFRSRLIRSQIEKEAQGTKVYAVSPSRLRNVEVSYPRDSAEQQEIADCLTSLDEVIAAHRRKVEALKAHKRGLMQQLFPREGETVPWLRFPEFRDGPEWKSTTLEQLAVIQSGSTPAKVNPAFWNGLIPWVSAKDMKKLFLQDSADHISTAAVDNGARLVPAGTLLMLTRGMTLLKDVPVCVLREEMAFNQDVKALLPKENTNSLFLAFLLLGNKGRLLRMVDISGHGTGKLNTDELSALELMSPRPAEQRRIANCFSSLEAQIGAELAKLTSLRAHKKGLMQQLFPSPETI